MYAVIYRDYYYGASCGPSTISPWKIRALFSTKDKALEFMRIPLTLSHGTYRAEERVVKWHGPPDEEYIDSYVSEHKEWNG